MTTMRTKPATVAPTPPPLGPFSQAQSEFSSPPRLVGSGREADQGREDGSRPMATAHGAQHDARHALGHRRAGGPTNPPANGPADGGPIDAAWVIARLEDAGRTLLALPHTGPSPKLRMSVLDVVRDAVEGYGWGEGRLRAAYPDSAQVTRMDEALAWISRIPVDRYVLRRIVGARALINPTTDRHVYPWRRLAAALGADHKAVQRWHAQGITLIVASLTGGVR